MDRSPPSSSVHGILQQEYQSGLPFPSPGDLPYPGIKPTALMSPALAGEFFASSAPWEAKCLHWGRKAVCSLSDRRKEWKNTKPFYYLLLAYDLLFVPVSPGTLGQSQLKSVLRATYARLHFPPGHISEGPALWPKLGEAGALLIWVTWFPCQRFTVSLTFTFLFSLPPAFLFGFLFSGTEKRTTL